MAAERTGPPKPDEFQHWGVVYLAAALYTLLMIGLLLAFEGVFSL